MELHFIDLVLMLLGFGVGFATKFRTPLLLTMFLVKVVKWWFETHPHGKEVAKRTNFDEEFKKKFIDDLGDAERKLGI